MQSSSECLNLVRSCEGFRASPYRCPAGIPTIGYGSTRYADGRAVQLSDPPIDMGQADAIMRQTLKEYEAAVNRYVTVPINQNQFDALVDFAYNAGAQNLRNSTLLKLLNQGQYEQAARQFDRWVMSAGKRLPGLVKRRALEKALFLKPVQQA